MDPTEKNISLISAIAKIASFADVMALNAQLTLALRSELSAPSSTDKKHIQNLVTLHTGVSNGTLLLSSKVML